MARPSRDRIQEAVLGIVALVSDMPEEPEDGDRGPEEGGGGPEEPETSQRGWIDPDDRLWRHPSEVTPGGGDAAASHAPPHRPYRNAVMALVGVAAVVAAVAWVVVLVSPASQTPHGEAGNENTGNGASLTTLAGSQNTVPASAETVGRSMVELRATTAKGTVALVGVAVAEGGLVATMADPLVGARRLVMVGAGGKLVPASVVASDRASDVALVNVPLDLPVAPFAQDATLADGSPDVTLSFVAGGGSAVALHDTPGNVTGVGAAITSGPASGMPSITSNPAAQTAMAGAPLLDATGAVVGFAYDPGSGVSAPATFLPSGLVVGVADNLRSDNKGHGWLGVAGTDVPGGGGARVQEVLSGSPAAGHITPGMVIVAVNAAPVRTMAELRARVYVLAPGALVALTVQQGTQTSVVNVTLGGSS